MSLRKVTSLANAVIRNSQFLLLLGYTKAGVHLAPALFCVHQQGTS